MALTAIVVRQTKATGKDYTLPDFDGLSLAVSDAGTKSWHLRYTWLGRQKRMSLGMYPEISLREARARRDEARALVASGSGDGHGGCPGSGRGRSRLCHERHDHAKARSLNCAHTVRRICKIDHP